MDVGARVYVCEVKHPIQRRESQVASKLNPYISFDGNAREALEFYQDVLGGELDVNTFGDFGNDAGGVADKIMHGQLETDAGFTLMAADNPPGQDYTPGNNYAVSLSGDDSDKLRGYWDKLSDGGTVMVAAREADVGRRVRHVRRPVRRRPGWSTSPESSRAENTQRLRGSTTAEVAHTASTTPRTRARAVAAGAPGPGRRRSAARVRARPRAGRRAPRAGRRGPARPASSAAPTRK